MNQFLQKCFISLILFLTASAYAQTNGYKKDFNDGNIDGFVSDHLRTFQLSAESNALKINYTRTSSSDMWDNFNYTPPVKINISGNRLITVSVKSSVTGTISFKPIFDSGDQYMTKDITGDDKWHTLMFKVDERTNYNVTKIYMYIDGGTTAVKSGVVYFDDLRLGDSAYVEADWTYLDKALKNAELLLANTIEGSGEGEYPSGSKALLNNAVNTATLIRNSGTRDQKIADQAAWDLLDACVNLEKSVITVSVPIIDPSATKETRYLYLNLQQLQTRFLLFGMHDATGYGVGWSGDNDRSDVKSVVGDYPAVFSDDMSGTDSNPIDAGKDYRMTSAFNRGAVITFVWHQRDPANRGFYAADVNNENIVKTLIPGGSNHNFYKQRLKTVATFLKGLRGSKGENVPVIFRPYHEHTGGWFWWGAGQCSVNEYNTLWQFTVEYLRDSLNVHNLLYAISPSSTGINALSDYEKIYPGNNYIDIMGGDFYFSSPSNETEIINFTNFSRIVGNQSLKTTKVGAMTEVGQEGLKDTDWFTRYLLNPLKSDSIASNLVYAAVWRNANTSHHYAPYPGHPSVPDFITFYNDPYTMFEEDLPDMYKFPEQDKTAPLFVSNHDSVMISSSVNVKITVETNERAFLRYSELNSTYDEMTNQFLSGEGSFKHIVYIQSNQGETKTLYVQAADLFGNKTTDALDITFRVDTLQAPVMWAESIYPYSTWAKGISPIGTSSTAVTKSSNSKTIYFRKDVPLDSLPSALAVMVKGNGGSVLYVNGYEAGRYNLSSSVEINFDTEPTVQSSFTKSFTLDKTTLSKLRKGNNTFAVEIHAGEGASVAAFDVQILDIKLQKVLPFGTEWAYYDIGNRPADVKVGDITFAMTEENAPSEYALFNNYPNPFNAATVITYSLPELTSVKLTIYDILGREVVTLVNAEQQRGMYSRRFDASDLSSGIYVYRLETKSFIQTQKMLLLK